MRSQGIRTHTPSAKKGALRGRTASQTSLTSTRVSRAAETANAHHLFKLVSNSTLARLALPLWPLLALRGRALLGAASAALGHLPQAVCCGNPDSSTLQGPGGSELFRHHVREGCALGASHDRLLSDQETELSRQYWASHAA